MKKLLFCGDINSQWSILIDRVNKLQTSAHGPFDGLFCVGSFFKDEDEFFYMAPKLDFPLPVFVADRSGYSDDFNAPKNVMFLPPAGLELILGMTVATLGRGVSVSNHPVEVAQLLGKASANGYRGCDILITVDWPKDVLQFIPEDELRSLQAAGVSISGGSATAAEVASVLAPRLHFCGAANICYDRPPYRSVHDAHSDTGVCHSIYSQRGRSDASSCPTLDNCTFFHSLAGLPLPGVVDSDKTRRWMKAMNYEPMTLGASPNRPLPPGTPVDRVSDCPYVTVGAAPIKRSGIDQFNESSIAKRARPHAEGGFSGVSEPRPPLPPGPRPDHQQLQPSSAPPPTSQPHSAPSPPSFFFGDMGVPRGGGQGRGPARGHQVLQPPSADARSLFVGGLPLHFTSAEPAASEAVLMKLFPGAIRVKCVPNKPFAFVDFDSHESARRVIKDHVSKRSVFSLPASSSADGRPVELSLGWGKDKDKATTSESRHGARHQGVGGAVPASHFEDCWFCLASPVAKVHLVVSVSEFAYLSLPRGGICEGHVLVVPIECVPNRTLASADSLRDMDRYLGAIEDMYRSTEGIFKGRMLCYERAIRTRGRDHMQLHCLPVQADQVPHAVARFMQIAHEFGLNFQEILGEDVSVAEAVVAMSKGSAHTPEYFYVRLPCGEHPDSRQTRRFLYIHNPATKFKMHFGSEMAVRILGCAPERANWKLCALPEEAEQGQAASFRAALEPFDFTLQQE